MQHEVSEYQLKSGGRGLIVNVPGAPVMASAGLSAQIANSTYHGAYGFRGERWLRYGA